MRPSTSQTSSYSFAILRSGGGADETASISRFAMTFAPRTAGRRAAEGFAPAEGLGLPTRVVFVRAFAAGLPRVLPRRAGCWFLGMMVPPAMCVAIQGPPEHPQPRARYHANGAPDALQGSPDP